MKYEHLSHRHQYKFGDFALAGATKNYAPDLQLEPVHTALHLTVDLKQRSAAGYALITLRANVAGQLTIKLDAIDFEDLIVKDLSDKGLDYRYNDLFINLSF